MQSDRTLLALAVLAIIGLAAAWLAPSWTVSFATLALAKSIVIIGLIVLMRAALVPFGQALFYGAGAYTTALLVRMAGIQDALLLLSLSLLVCGLLAFLLGFIMSRYREIFFAMLSLSFSMILYGVLVKNAELGGTDGFTVTTPTFFGSKVDVATARRLLLGLAVLLSLGSAVLIHVFLRSPLGALAEAIRDNEIRVEYLGTSVRRAIHIKFTLAGALAGLGGGLAALSVGHVSPEMTYWTTSGELVFTAILGGTGNVLAPLLGAFVFESVATLAIQYAPHFWQMMIGVVLLVVILFLAGGLWSLVQRKKTA
jgi:branched-chain amino acid transport system permease protein